MTMRVKWVIEGSHPTEWRCESKRIYASVCQSPAAFAQSHAQRRGRSDGFFIAPCS